MSNPSTRLLYRRRRVAHMLDVSETQVLKFERDGLLHPIRMDDVRAVWYLPSEVEDLAQRWIANSLTATEAYKA